MAATKDFQLKGIETVIAGLNRELKKIEGKSLNGLRIAAAQLREDMENTQPLIPVDLGNLRASWFITSGKGSIGGPGGGFKGENASELASEHSQVIAQAQAVAAAKTQDPFIVMGFTANYAVFVHEMVDARFFRPEQKKHKGRPGSGAKFFEKALKRNVKKMLQTIKLNTQLR